MLTELTIAAQELVAFSLVMGAQIGLVLLLRKLVMEKLGAVACYRLWLLPVLWLPLYWLGPMLFETLGRLLYTNAFGATHYYMPLQQFRHFELLPFNFSTEATELTQDGDAASYGWAAFAVLWIAGTVATILWQGFRWFDFSRQVNKLALPLSSRGLEDSGAVVHFDRKVRVLSLRGIRSAALFGIFRPVLLLPESFSQRHDSNQRHIILAHEAVHLHRRDNCWNLCALLLLALFWTNPLVLLAWHYYRLDQEMSCDALALAHCNKEQQKCYARTLLDSLRSLPKSGTQPALSAWDNLRDLKERSLMIQHHLVTAARPATMLCSLVLLALLGASLTITFAELANAAEPVEAQITKVAALLAENKPEEARTELEPLLQAGQRGELSEGAYLQAMQMSASLNMNDEKFTEARADLEAVLEMPNLPQETITQTTYAIAQSYIPAEQWPEAVEHLSQWLEMSGSEGAGPLYLLAVAHYQQGQYEEGITYMERLFALPDQEFREPWYQMMNALYLQTKQWEKAKGNLEKMVGLFAKPAYQETLDRINAGDLQTP
jgi:beta-lactamase regulating signal transducer with metallopeptidase domain